VLLRRYDAMRADIPADSMRLHLCLRASDEIVIVDACPTQAAFEEFASGPFPALRARHGIPEPRTVHDLPVHVAVVEGGRFE
jgi:hypothetical protein